MGRFTGEQEEAAAAVVAAVRALGPLISAAAESGLHVALWFGGAEGHALGLVESGPAARPECGAGPELKVLVFKARLRADAGG